MRGGLRVIWQVEVVVCHVEVADEKLVPATLQMVCCAEAVGGGVTLGVVSGAQGHSACVTFAADGVVGQQTVSLPD